MTAILLLRPEPSWRRLRSTTASPEHTDDPKAQVRRVPALFAQTRSEDRQAPQPRHLPDPPSGREARARRPILQAPRTLSAPMARSPRKRPRAQPIQARLWSNAVTRDSNALDLEPSVFTRESPRQIALSLKRSAE